MRSTKKKDDFMEDETILKTSKHLWEIVKEEMGIRKILFKFFKKNLESIEYIDKSAHRKLQKGYGGDLTNVRMSDLTQDIIIWKEVRKEICKDCIIIANCSDICSKVKEKYSSLHQNHSKELWNEQKSKV